jgi:hypothetical protein
MKALSGFRPKRRSRPFRYLAGKNHVFCRGRPAGRQMKALSGFRPKRRSRPFRYLAGKNHVFCRPPNEGTERIPAKAAQPTLAQ